MYEVTLGQFSMLILVTENLLTHLNHGTIIYLMNDKNFLDTSIVFSHSNTPKL